MILIRKIIFVVFLSPILLSSQVFLLSNEDFENMNFSFSDVRKFVNSFIECKLTTDQIDYITRIAYKEKVHPLVIITKLQQESSLIENDSTLSYIERENKAMGCRLYNRHTGKQNIHYWGFQNQVREGTRIIRFYFDSYQRGDEIELLYGKERGRRLEPLNAATYSLYVYCPCYGKVFNPDTGRSSIGNALFARKFNAYKRKWIKLFGNF